jgi:serine/threonine protein phosphatase PrpC
MRLDIAAQTDTGRRKRNNEDACGVFREDTPGLQLFDEGALLVVADGLGGHANGEIASKLAVSMVRDVLKDPAPAVDDADEVEAGDAGPLPNLRSVMLKANDSIYQTNRDAGNVKRPMGTTLLAAVVQPKFAYIANIGDSRAYHIREGEIVNVTEDHSWVDEQVKAGLMSKAEAETDQRKNIVTRCIGTHAEITVDTYRWFVVPGDMVMLCTDGLVNMVPDKDIKKEFRIGGTAAEIAQRLVALANENGGKDNITVIIATISPSFVRMLRLQVRSMLRRGGITPTVGLFLFVYGFACATAGYLLHWFKPLF